MEAMDKQTNSAGGFATFTLRLQHIFGVVNNATQEAEEFGKVLKQAYANYQQGSRIKKRRKKVNVNSTVDSTSGPGNFYSASSIASDFSVISSVSEYASEIDASTSGRPKRAAKCLASSKIRKQTIMPLNGKYRRPDSSDGVDEYGLIKSFGPKDSVQNSTMREADYGFVKPKPRKRGLRTEESISSVHMSADTPSTVRDRIAYLEALNKQSDKSSFQKASVAEKEQKSVESNASKGRAEALCQESNDVMRYETNRTDKADPVVSRSPRRSLRLSNTTVGNIGKVCEASSDKEPELSPPLSKSSPLLSTSKSRASVMSGTCNVGKHQLSISPVATVTGNDSNDLFIGESPTLQLDGDPENNQNVINTLQGGTSTYLNASFKVSDKQHSNEKKVIEASKDNITEDVIRRTRNNTLRGLDLPGEEKSANNICMQESTFCIQKSISGQSRTFIAEPNLTFETTKTVQNPNIENVPMERSTRAKPTWGKCLPEAEVCTHESTTLQNSNAQSGTFVAGQSFPVENTGGNKRTKAKKRVKPSEHLTDFSPPAIGDFDSGTFVIPNIPSKRTKPVVKPIMHDPDGNMESFHIENTGGNKGTKAKKRVKPSEHLTDFSPPAIGDFDSGTFVIPNIPSKRTKPVAKPIMHDADGNIITRATASATSENPAPELLMELRPVRTRTKARRFGDDETGPEVSEIQQESKRVRTKARKHDDADMPDSNEADEHPLRVTRSKAFKSKKQDENAKVRGGEKRVSNGKKRSQQKHSGRKFINPYKTPLSSQTNKLLAKKVLTLPSASKVIVKSKQEECEYAKKLLKKETLAAQKKEQELLQKKIKLKQKNEEKLQRVRRCREEMDLEKQEQVAQAEKEKELKRKQLLEEQRAKKQEELSKKKQLAAIKMAEHEERRRLENEARQAKLRELELEQQRQQQAKVELQLLEEKRARERLEEKRKLQEQEKLLKLNIQNRQLMGQKNKPTPHDYKARGEDDFGLEDEHSELNSDDDSPPPPKRPFPSWVTGMKAAGEVLKYFTFEQMALFVPAAAKTPDIRKMCNITPTRIFRRNSSAIWNTPGFTP